MKKILLVEDEDLLLRTVAKTLRQLGNDVTAVGNGKQALQEIVSVHYDICFLDVQLPDANGLELMHQVLEISPATKVVIMTALTLSSTQLLDLKAHCCPLLRKPFSLEAVRSLADGARNGGEHDFQA